MRGMMTCSMALTRRFVLLIVSSRTTNDVCPRTTEGHTHEQTQHRERERERRTDTHTHTHTGTRFTDHCRASKEKIKVSNDTSRKCATRKETENKEKEGGGSKKANLQRGEFNKQLHGFVPRLFAPLNFLATSGQTSQLKACESVCA